MAYKAGDQTIKNINIPIRELLDKADVAEATAFSFTAMVTAAKSIIKTATAGAAGAGGNPIVFAAIGIVAIAEAVADKAIDYMLKDTDTIKLSLYLEYRVRKVNKQGSVWNIGEWKVYDYSTRVL